MKLREKIWHLWMGFISGRSKTCGKKIDYKSFKTSEAAAKKLSIKFNKEMEAYPCVFCRGWHIGRKMS